MTDLTSFIEAIERRKRRKQLEGNFIALLHHELMSAYGWIPFEEFKKLPIITVLNLREEIRKEAERYNKGMKNLKVR